MDKINPEVVEYVKKRDVEAVKSTLTGLAYIIGSFETFKDSAEYAMKELGNIFDEDDGAEFNKEKTLSNYKYIARLMLDNFSKMKYEAAVEIGLEIFKSQDKKQEKNIHPFQKALGIFQRVLGIWLRWVKRNPLVAVIIIAMVIAFVVIKGLK